MTSTTPDYKRQKQIALSTLIVLMTSGAAHDPVLPIRWDDNDATLFAGQGATLTGRYSATGVSVPVVRVEGFNLTAPVVVV